MLRKLYENRELLKFGLGKMFDFLYNKSSLLFLLLNQSNETLSSSLQMTCR